MTGGLKMGVNVAAHTRHIFLGSAPPGCKDLLKSIESIKYIEFPFPGCKLRVMLFQVRPTAICREDNGGGAVYYNRPLKALQHGK